MFCISSALIDVHVTQAKAIDSIKRALVQITTSYKKENQESTPCSELQADSSSSIKSRGILSTQQPRYDNMVSS